LLCAFRMLPEILTNFAVVTIITRSAFTVVFIDWNINTTCSVLTGVGNTRIWFWKIITWWSISVILKQHENHTYFQTYLRNIPLTSEREFWSCGSTLSRFIRFTVPGHWCVTVRKFINCCHTSLHVCKGMVHLLKITDFKKSCFAILQLWKITSDLSSSSGWIATFWNNFCKYYEWTILRSVSGFQPCVCHATVVGHDTFPVGHRTCYRNQRKVFYRNHRFLHQALIKTNYKEWD